LPAGFLVLVSKVAYLLPQPSEAITGIAEMRQLLSVWFLISNGEFVEMAIAWFMMWYMLSYLVRFRHSGRLERSPDLINP
jgi:hypothetical protein